MLAGDELGDGVHGAGAVEGHDGRQVLDGLGPQAHAHPGHPGGLHLEHAGGPPGGEHIVDRLIVLRDVLQAEVRLAGADHLHRVVQDGEVAQGQKVHLQQAQLLQGHHGVLTDHGVVVFRQGHVGVHGMFRDDHPGGVGGGVAGHPLQGLGGVDELLDLGVPLVEVPEGLAQPQGVVEGDVDRGGHLLGHHVHLRVGQVHHPPHVPDDAPGGHGAEGDDLGHPVAAVLPADVGHHLVPPGVAEVQVKVRHGDPLRVQEALEEQAVLLGVHVGDLQAVGHDGGRAAPPPGPYGDALTAGVVDEVGDNEKVVGKAHLLDHVQLIVQLGVVVRVPAAVAPGEALLAQAADIRLGRLVCGHPEFRQVVLAEGELQIAEVRDALRVGEGLRIAAEEGLHLLRGAEVEVLGLVAHPLLVLHQLAGLDAEEDVVALRVLGGEVVAVVGTDQGDARLLVDAEEGLVHHRLVPDAVVLELQVEPVLPEEALHLQGVVLCAVIISV